jgi:hydrogenase expression/formation protein HypC
MCLGIPVKVTQREGSEGVGEFKGVKRNISFALLDDARVGDYVILHAGFAIQKLDPKEAEKTLKLFEELARLEDE